MDRVTASLVAAPFVFGVAAILTRAPARRIGASLVAGLAFAAGNVGWDLVARRWGWWRYPGFDGHGPLHWYAAAGLAAAGVALIGWRIRRRFGHRGLVVFIAAFAVLIPIRDHGVSRAAEPAIVFGPGPWPWLADAAAGFSLMALAIAVLLAFGGDVGRLRGRS